MSEAPKISGMNPGSLPDRNAEDDAPVNIDAILQSILGWRSERFGMAAAVLKGERIIARGVAGVRKRGTVERITLNDRFHLGSCTKAMTATLAAMLVEKGKLNWSATLGEIFAGRIKDMHPAWEKVTLQQVLAHRAGLRRDAMGQLWVFAHLLLTPYASLGREPEWRRTLRVRLDSHKETLPQQRLEIVRQALVRPPKFPSGTKGFYSNVGYILMGVVLENITGCAWEDLMREKLFQPLGILTGGFGPPGNAGKTDQPWGHTWGFGKALDPGCPAADVPSFYGPAGLAHMTITDWAKFIGLHLRGDPANPHCHATLLKPHTFAELHPSLPATNLRAGWIKRGTMWLALGDASPAATYHAGWVITTASWAKGVRTGDTGRRLWHSGSNGSWNCAVSIAPEIDFAVLVACNRSTDIGMWKTRQATKALIRAFAAKPTS